MSTLYSLMQDVAKMKLKKELVKDPSNPSRTKWGYFAWMKKGRKEGWFRVTKTFFMDIKYKRLLG